MSVLNILKYPDPRLHRIAKVVTVFDDNLKRLVADMAETMYAAPGIGLAAPQVNVQQRVIVVDVTEDKSDLNVFINPEVAFASTDMKVFDEGCLSVPGVYENVERPDRITVRAMDVNGKVFTKECDGLMAVCVQHEIDHLNGKVFVQYLSRLKQNRIRSKMQKLLREQRAADVA